MRVQKQYKLEYLDELWCIDWKTPNRHREVWFYLERDLGITIDSPEARFLWKLLRTIQQETLDASKDRRAPEAGSTLTTTPEAIDAPTA